MAVYGVYRGVCVDNRDPLGQGRVRVIVPQVLGDAASGWAFPSWGMDDLVTWPEDRIPKPGQGVWILFEGADRLTWISAFGPQEFSEQHKENSADYYGTALTIEMSVLPEDIPVPITGTLTSPAGIPWPGAIVRFERSFDLDDWILAAEGDVDAEGNWSIDYTRTAGEDNWWYRASFHGVEPYGPSDSEPVQVPIPQYASDLTWSDPDPEWQREAYIEGRLTKADDGIGIEEEPIHLYTKIADGPWLRAMTTETSYGDWSFLWTRTKEMTQDMSIRVVYLGSPTYDYVQIPDPAKNLGPVQVPVDISWEPPASFSVGTTAVFIGTINSEYGVPEPSPLVQLQVRSPSSQVTSSSTWADAESVAVRADGTWTINHVHASATADYRVKFLPTGVYLTTTTDEISEVSYVEVAVSKPQVPSSLYFGTAFSVTGTVTDLLGGGVTNGIVVLEKKIGTSTTWEDESPPTDVASNGTYALVHRTPAFVGNVQYRVRYADNPFYGYQAGLSPILSTRVGLRPPVLSRTRFSATSVTLSWTAVPGAQIYHPEIRVEGYPDSATYVPTTDLYQVINDLNPAFIYYFQIAANRTGPDGWYVTSWSNILKYKPATQQWL